ncbi:tetratricopeptide repeat protein [Myxococcus xanthus DK 1622]|uniref:Tetratricopeptide repeat protein n=1 Tax=Myxococcus xanthus (strain DK1622) TaxID=246197 RepID=Q1D405_MYXXD|nr:MULTISPECIES: tetratricopeptide repeat protein [Myxococcus]ABF87426.1 tetratricopeptide repeat protein [Myxococcus xanthus DK 1622]NOJ51000.1 tetratricopeptide repeat protein [Myxococcus xanthus]QPM77028.1 tetratricopeptide repeat protein [Myxococcus xanthus]QVW66096.1 tetratricopeptide repeat protein [Myxococcus xanthus DZ2]QZZ52131.1 Beta-barrel assembly-enhancing protease [Myxococcus xanthus]
MFPRPRALSLIALLALTGCDDETPRVKPKDHAEGLYVKGTAEYLQGHFDAALASFEAMKQIAPDDPRLPAARGEVYLSMGRLTDAAAEFEAALKLEPKRSTNWSRLGFIQTQLGQVVEAQSSLRKALSLFPQDFNALESLGDLDLKKGDHDAAVRHFTLASNAAPSPEQKSALIMRALDVLSSKQRYPELLVAAQKAVDDGIHTADVLATLGDALVRAGNLTEAANAYRDAASRSPRDPTLWELVGEIQMKLDKPGDAISAYKESLRVQDRAIVHVALARIYLGMKDAAAAKEELSAALESVSGQDIRELRELASLLATMDRKPDALRILANLSAEQDHAKDAELHVATAQLARELKDTGILQAACARATAADATLKKCP